MPRSRRRVAQAIKEWAISRGATHFTHWFQPQTGLTAEKHDAFLIFDDNGQPIETFTGAQLIQSEPDASSFPSGGMRATLEARGYTAWNPASPVFIVEIGRHAHAVHPVGVHQLPRRSARRDDAAAPRSRRPLRQARSSCSSCSATRACMRVFTTLGPEQEYFLIDRDALRAAPRPRDGRPHAHRRAAAARAAARGPLLRRHPGAHPGLHRRGRARAVQARRADHDAAQRSRAVPVRDGADLRGDQHRRRPQPDRHGDAAARSRCATACRRCCTRSRSPASTASASTATGRMSIAADNPSSTASTCSSRARRRTRTSASSSSSPRCSRACTSTRACCAPASRTSGNDHRLGANEAPPAIISVFLGDHAHAASSSAIAAGKTSAKRRAGDDQARRRASCPRSRRTTPTATARRRSPSPATSSSSAPSARRQSIAFPIVLLNAAVAEALGEITEQLKATSSRRRRTSTTRCSRSCAKRSRRRRAVRFEGNNYSEEWVKEAAKRGLLNLRRTPEALAQLDHAARRKSLLTQARHLHEGGARVALPRAHGALHQGHAHRDAHAAAR